MNKAETNACIGRELKIREVNAVEKRKQIEKIMIPTFCSLK